MKAFNSEQIRQSPPVEDYARDNDGQAYRKLSIEPKSGTGKAFSVSVESHYAQRVEAARSSIRLVFEREPGTHEFTLEVLDAEHNDTVLASGCFTRIECAPDALMDLIEYCCNGLEAF